jgi:quercetin dioxygenase-like cupin family protein
MNEGERGLVKQMEGPFLKYVLQSQIDLLRRERAYQHGRNSKTMAKYPDFRIVLTVIKAGAHMQKHTATGRISVQVVDGHIRMQVREELFDLPVGHLLVLDRGIPHNVDGVNDNAFLLTIAWPEG